MDAAHHLVAGGVRVIVRDAGDEFARRVAPAERDAAEFEMPAFFDQHDHFDPAQPARGDHAEDLAGGILAHVDAQAAQFGGVADRIAFIGDNDGVAKGLAFGHVDIAPLVERAEVHACKRVRVRIAPGFVFPRREDDRFAHAASAITAS